MNPAEKNEKEYWENWLDDKYDHSSEKLANIRDAVKSLYDNNKKTEGDLPYFTPHDTFHCESVEDMLHKLIPNDKHHSLSTREKYYLLISAWVHDIGMLPLVSSKVYKNEPAFDEYEIRKRHHMTSELFIVNYWYDLKIEEIDKEVIGKLARFHRRSEDINECDEVFIVRNEMIRLRLLASYLRLADALDISISRAPAEYYALCLAYNMSDDSKYHWIKSRLVVGVYPDDNSHLIRVTFKYPKEEYVSGNIDYKSAIDKLDKIKKMVIDDLRDELRSIINVITKGNITYYLDIEAVKSAVCYDEKMLNDLREIVINYDIMGAPSDSKLLEFIFGAVANIVGYSLSKNMKPVRFVNIKKERYSVVKERLVRFLNVIEKRVLKNRPYPFGLINAISQIKISNEMFDENKDCNWGLFVNMIDDKYKQHLGYRRDIRIKSKDMFEAIHDKVSNKEERIKIMLYGFSELVTKCLCGMRDKIINEKYDYKFDEYSDMIYCSDIEKEASDLMMIYVCECQPKTQTYLNDRIVYHDGSQYALHLKKYGFGNIVIIPDIMSAAFIEKMSIDYLVVGANGLTNEYFIHSPGLSSIAKIAKTNNNINISNLKTILVTLSDKYNDIRPDKEKCNESEYEVVEGNYFYYQKKLGINRKNIWMCRDVSLLNKLYSEKIAFCNPLEDEIKYDDIDYLVTEKGWVKNGEKYWFKKVINI